MSQLLRFEQRFVVALGHSFRFESHPAIRWGFLIAFLVLLATFCFPSSAQSQAEITVDLATATGTVNSLLFGNNVSFASNGGILWDVRTNDLYPGAKPFIQTIAPSVLRFPGGGLSDDYFWEDAIGYKTIVPAGH